jgi:DNA-binding XRE family transcriptional regulator
VSIEDINKEALKKEIGFRFKQFRQAIKKNQYELAVELDINQTSVTNIEKGKTFPTAYIQN